MKNSKSNTHEIMDKYIRKRKYYCCERESSYDNFEAGHIADANGGKVEIDNLKVICYMLYVDHAT
jgi:hypothetical protein